MGERPEDVVLTESMGQPGELLPLGELRLLLPPGGGVGLSSMSRLLFESPMYEAEVDFRLTDFGLELCENEAPMME